jgi:tetratricopeptide (TPR) repeat protein
MTLALVLALVIAGCTHGVKTTTPDSRPDLAQALSGAVFFDGAAPPPLPDADILALDQPMRDFLARYVDRRANQHLRLEQLVYAVISNGTFGLQYSDSTRTAAQTFADHNGNCLSFTTMFIAMAREAGLKAGFQQIAIPPDWEERGDTLVLNRHINVLVKLSGGDKKVVDFNIEDFKTSYDRAIVPDARAHAHYYSNIGVEKLQAGDQREAFRYLRKAIDTDSTFSTAWTNLGSLYRRAGHLHLAEASYLQALDIDRAELVAMSNLAELYQQLGEQAKADHYRRIARHHRHRNPYFRFHRAREAFLARDYAGALAHLDSAIRRKPEEDSFYFLRRLVRLQLGDKMRAREDLEHAENIAGNAMLKRNYHSKMEMLLHEQR